MRGKSPELCPLNSPVTVAAGPGQAPPAPRLHLTVHTTGKPSGSDPGLPAWEGVCLSDPGWTQPPPAPALPHPTLHALPTAGFLSSRCQPLRPLPKGRRRQHDKMPGRAIPPACSASIGPARHSLYDVRAGTMTRAEAARCHVRDFKAEALIGCLQTACLLLAVCGLHTWPLGDHRAPPHFTRLPENKLPQSAFSVSAGQRCSLENVLEPLSEILAPLSWGLKPSLPLGHKNSSGFGIAPPASLLPSVCEIQPACNSTL